MTTLTQSASDRVHSAFPFTVDKLPLHGPDNMPTPHYGLFRSDNWQPRGMPFGKAFAPPNHGDPDEVLDYTVQVEAVGAGGTEYSVPLSLHVIGVELPP